MNIKESLEESKVQELGLRKSTKLSQKHVRSSTNESIASKKNANNVLTELIYLRDKQGNRIIIPKVQAKKINESSAER